MLNADQITSANENIALSIAYGSILASMIASSIIVEEAVAVAHIELKSITAQRLMMVFSLVAHNFVQYLFSKEIKNKFLLDKLRSLLHLLICRNREHRPTLLEKVVMLIY